MRHVRFVVQEHLARRKHYDFRIEVAGVFKSWAVPKGPPVLVGERRLAVMTADHDLSFGSFAGVIPPGEYGAGIITIWDQGTFTSAGPCSMHRRGRAGVDAARGQVAWSF